MTNIVIYNYNDSYKNRINPMNESIIVGFKKGKYSTFFKQIVNKIIKYIKITRRINFNSFLLVLSSHR